MEKYNEDWLVSHMLGPVLRRGVFLTVVMKFQRDKHKPLAAGECLRVENKRINVRKKAAACSFLPAHVIVFHAVMAWSHNIWLKLRKSGEKLRSWWTVEEEVCEECEEEGSSGRSSSKYIKNMWVVSAEFSFSKGNNWRSNQI